MSIHASSIADNIVIPISCYIRTLNEELQIVETIRAAKQVADEVIIVDSGSTDSTVQLAVAEGVRVVEQSWLGYGHQKRAGEEACRHDWLLDIDADEVVSEELAREIHALFSDEDPCSDIYELPLVTIDPSGRIWKKSPVVRRAKLYDRRKIRAPAHGVWDQFQIPSNLAVGRLEGALLHHSFSGMGQLALKMAKANILQASLMNPRSFLLSALKVYFGLPIYFLVRYVIRGWWREGTYGFMAAVAVSYAHWCRHAILHETHLRDARKTRHGAVAVSPLTSEKRQD